MRPSGYRFAPVTAIPVALYTTNKLVSKHTYFHRRLDMQNRSQQHVQHFVKLTLTVATFAALTLGAALAAQTAHAQSYNQNSSMHRYGQGNQGQSYGHMNRYGQGNQG